MESKRLSQVERVLAETREEMAGRQRQVRHFLMTENVPRRGIEEEHLETDEDDVTSGLGYIPALMGPEMCLTLEEKAVLDRLLTKQREACRNCCPVRFVLQKLFKKRFLIYLFPIFVCLLKVLHR